MESSTPRSRQEQNKALRSEPIYQMLVRARADGDCEIVRLASTAWAIWLSAPVRPRFAPDPAILLVVTFSITCKSNRFFFIGTNQTQRLTVKPFLLVWVTRRQATI